MNAAELDKVAKELFVTSPRGGFPSSWVTLDEWARENWRERALEMLASLRPPISRSTTMTTNELNAWWTGLPYPVRDSVRDTYQLPTEWWNGLTPDMKCDVYERLRAEKLPHSPTHEGST